ncbi:MAG: acyl-CoA/acyl-ACP dehydrogenase [Proteobacteria bacterium]|nr:acyl-CoA/acyl-ACP dehydrogenase [Pseudomonadota bacterium]
MSDSDNIIVDTTAKILGDLCDPQTINNAKDDGWKAPLWQALEENGLTRTWVPEEFNGAGAEIADGFEVLRVAGQFAIPLPLAETLLAGWLLAEAGLAVPDGMLSIAPVNSEDEIILGGDGTLSGKAYAVPFGRDVAQIAVLAKKGSGYAVALVNRDDCIIQQTDNHASEPRDTVEFNNVTVLEAADTDLTQDHLMRMGAAVRCAEMGGALQHILNIAVDYAKEREAFGRPISKFQAVQHNLAQLAGETAAAVSAATSAADTINSGEGFSDAGLLEIASAKIRVGEAAGKGAAIGHQVHGAIGYTIEHMLHRYTQRLWGWRDDFGSESVWAVRLGEMIAANGADELWPMISAR